MNLNPLIEKSSLFIQEFIAVFENKNVENYKDLSPSLRSEVLDSAKEKFLYYEVKEVGKPKIEFNFRFNRNIWFELNFYFTNDPMDPEGRPTYFKVVSSLWDECDEETKDISDKQKLIIIYEILENPKIRK